MVKKFIGVLTSLLTLISIGLGAQVIPQPQSVVPEEGVLVWDKPLSLSYKLARCTDKNLLEYITSLPDSLVVMYKHGAAKGQKTLRLIQSFPEFSTDKEAYELKITPSGAEIRAGEPAGLFYGVQTLLQLRDSSPAGIGCLTIQDSPRFHYRGFMLDVSRHFFDKEFIFKQIDILSSVKVNVLHLHLVDTGGWRLESEKYPQLTEQAAFRTHCDWQEWAVNGGAFCPKGDGAYGGFYTKDDIRDIVHYAAVRHMEVIPEIDMPGHSSEVLSVIPELRCENAKPGTAEMCLGNPQTYQFCMDILDEIIGLFPSKYVHIGGDECGTGAWAACPRCREYMSSHGITDVSEYQNHFTKRIEAYLTSKGKTVIGWDEMLSDDLDHSTTIMSWHEDPDGREAVVKAGHPMIVSSEGHFYLDYYQDYPLMEPLCFAGYTPARKTYGFDPLDGLATNPELVLGLQCNLWTEAIKTPEAVERMMYPRVLAMAETAWSMPEHYDYDDFRMRVLAFQGKMKAAGYNPFDLANEFGPRPGSNIPVSCLSTGKTVTYARHWSANFPALGEPTLTDGLIADWGMNGLRWMGFDAYMDVTVDLEDVRDINSVRCSFMQNSFTAMLLPEIYEISISDDGQSFRPIYHLNYPSDSSARYCIQDFGWTGRERARYVRVKASHPSGWCWLMCDEIIVQ